MFFWFNVPVCSTSSISIACTLPKQSEKEDCIFIVQCVRIVFVIIQYIGAKDRFSCFWYVVRWSEVYTV